MPWSRPSVTENISTLLSRNHHKNSEKTINLERDLHKMEQYSRQECIKIAGIPPSIMNDLLEEQVLLISMNLIQLLVTDLALLIEPSWNWYIGRMLWNYWKIKINWNMQIYRKTPARKTITRIIVATRLVYLNRLRIERIFITKNLNYS